MSEPLVSVIIPSHRPHLLPHAEASVYAQTYRDVQLLVNHCYRYWPDKINDIAKAARGKYLVVLCDDDALNPDFIRKTVKLAESCALDITGTTIRTFGDDSQEWYPQPFTAETFAKTSTPFITSLIRTDLWRELGGYDPEQLFQDRDFYYRAFKRGVQTANVLEPLFLYRLHDDNGGKSLDHGEAHRVFLDKHPELKAVA